MNDELEATDRMLDLVRSPRLVLPDEGVIGPPVFLIPAAVERALLIPLCGGCGRGIVVAATGVIAWGDRLFHPTCAHDELLALRSAA